MSEKEILQRYKKYITEIIQPSCILQYLDFFKQDEVERIKARETQEGLTQAASLLMDLILSVEAPGWYRMFLDSLSNAGYNDLSEALESSDFTAIEKANVNKELVRKLSPSLRHDVHPKDILLHLHEGLLQAQREEIEQVTERFGAHHGMSKLLDFLLRSDNPKWYNAFVDSLAAGRYSSLVCVLDERGVSAVNLFNLEKKAHAVSVEDLQGHDQFQDPEDLENLKNEFSKAESPFPDTDDQSGDEQEMEMSYSEEAEMERLAKLRDYQVELAEPALKGKNTIICAPTGSGKTVVAVEICSQHLKQGTEEQKKKVAFLANTIPLCQQQMDLFQKYFGNTEYEVTGLFGESTSAMAVSVGVESYDIVVMTPKILEMNLENYNIPGLSTFTLIFFDECHNTIKNHSYSAIMKMYMDTKLGNPAAPLPQIVGLTASVGTGKSKNEHGIREHIYNLCASLDTDTISTVIKHVEELRAHVIVPHKDTRIVKSRACNPFMDIVLGLMAHVESIVAKTYNLEALTKIPMSTRGSQMYEQWIVEVQRSCRVLKLEDEEMERQVCRKLVTCTEHLRKYNDCLIISEDARVVDALKYLLEYFNNLDPAYFDETDEKLARIFEEKRSDLQALACEKVQENPKLLDLQLVFEEQYRYNPSTRTILFVKTRALAEAIKQWVLETSALAHLKPKVLIGRRKTDNISGMTLSNQKAVLDAFKSEGGSKLLIATSVADEGIDIVTCNLVLLYDYVGNVIKMVQTRGRGRAKDSRCILITSKTEHAVKEQINIMQEKIVYESIEEIQKVNHEVFLSKIKKIQMNEKKKRDFERQMAVSKKKHTDVYDLLCGTCFITACTSDELRLLQEHHRVVISKSFSSLCNLKPHPKPKFHDDIEMKQKISCGKCNRDWGIMGTWKGLQSLPLLKTDGFAFLNRRTQQKLVFKKWQDFPGIIKEFNFLEVSGSTNSVAEGS
uniref:RNA helicase n=1 Tax=Lepisosteus oculatus TaxID=7918 RepID=W5MHM2_LEPOC